METIHTQCYYQKGLVKAPSPNYLNTYKTIFVHLKLKQFGPMVPVNFNLIHQIFLIKLDSQGRRRLFGVGNPTKPGIIIGDNLIHAYAIIIQLMVHTDNTIILNLLILIVIFSA